MLHYQPITTSVSMSMVGRSCNLAGVVRIALPALKTKNVKLDCACTVAVIAEDWNLHEKPHSTKTNIKPNTVSTTTHIMGLATMFKNRSMMKKRYYII